MAKQGFRVVDDDTSERLVKTIEALSIIKDMTGDRGKIKCPKCGNDLYWSRAYINGHIWGKCKTKSCLSWMQ